jgi:hypothetical protein
MGVNIKGGNNSAGLANVSTNYDLQVVTPTNSNNSGFVNISAEIDAGTAMGIRTTLPAEISDDYRLRVGTDQILYNLSFEGTNFPSGHLSTAATTMTSIQAAGFLVINSGSTVTAANANYTRTVRHFPLYGSYPTYLDMWIKEQNHTASNTISEWGYLYLTAQATQTPLDGVFFRRLANGALRAVINYGGTETEFTTDVTNVPARDGVGLYDPSETNHYLIAIHNDVVRFWINDILVASIDCPSNQQNFTASSNNPVGFRINIITSNASVARQMSIGYFSVSAGDQNSTKPYGHVLAGSGQGAYQAQQGSVAAQTANYTNSTIPTSATVSNTAASYTTLGGQWQMVANATNETDWALFGFTVPAGTTTLPGKTLYITSIRIGETVVVGAAPANPTTFFWAAAVGSSAVSLATADTVAGVSTTSSPRRVTLGAQSFLATTGIGTQSPGFTVDFSSSPLVAPSNTFFHIILKQFNGAATASLIWRGTVTVIGYWE